MNKLSCEGHVHKQYKAFRRECAGMTSNVSLEKNLLLSTKSIFIQQHVHYYSLGNVIRTQPKRTLNGISMKSEIINGRTLIILGYRDFSMLDFKLIVECP
jgi:hypothetical protein